MATGTDEYSVSDKEHLLEEYQEHDDSTLTTPSPKPKEKVGFTVNYHKRRL